MLELSPSLAQRFGPFFTTLFMLHNAIYLLLLKEMPSY